MQNSTKPDSGLSFILRTAFSYWNRTILYQLLFSFWYFLLLFGGYFYLLQYFGLWDLFMEHKDLVQTDLPAFNKKVEEISRMPQARNFGLAFLFLMALINPLAVGLYSIYRKVELKEKIGFSDVFAGYQGAGFFRFFGFYLFWIIIFTYANAVYILGFVWYLVTLFCIPLMYFMNIRVFEGIALTFKVLKKNFAAVFISVTVALLFSLSGFLLCGFGIFFTFPFIHAMIYTLYRQYFNEVR